MSFSERMCWEVRTTGNDNNSGGFRGGWSISPPAAPTLVNAGGSGISAGTYYFVLTYAQNNGAFGTGSGGKGTLESPMSAESSITLSGAANIQVNSPSRPTLLSGVGDVGDIDYCIYMATTPGGPYHPVNAGTGSSNTFHNTVGTNTVLDNNFDTSNANDYGPPGTDYSQQDGVQLTYTDLVIDGSNNQKLTSVTHPGTVQRLEIVNVDGSGAYYVDKSAGTLGSTGGQGKLGGALATPGLAGAQLEAGIDSGCVFIKAGTYTLTSGSTNVSGGLIRSDSSQAQFIGYNTNRFTYNQDQTKPTIKAGTDSTTILTIAKTYNQVANIKFDANTHSGMTAVATTDRNNLVRDCETTGGFSTGFDSTNVGNFFLRCFSDGDAGQGFRSNTGGNGTVFFECMANVSSSGYGFDLVGNASCVHCVAQVSAGQGFHSDASSNLFVNCTAYDTTGTSTPHTGNIGFSTNPSGTVIGGWYINCLAVGFAGSGSAGFTSGQPVASNLFMNCSAFNCETLFSTVKAIQVIHYAALSADPFLNSAGADFGLNNTAGAGRALRGAGQPGQTVQTGIPFITQDSYVDIGAVQTPAATGGMLVHPGYGGGPKG